MFGIKTTNVAVTIQEIQYTFTGNPQQNAIFINETTPVNFNVSESANSKTNYEMKYVINSRSAVIKNGSAVENPDVWYNVTVGTFSRTFVATHTGSVSGTFTVRNKTTLVEKSIPFSVNVKPSDFDFSAATASATSNIVKGTPVNVNFNLTQTAGSGDTYNLKFESTGTGTFLYKNVSYMPGSLIPITVGASKGVYNGITSGDHDITFTVENQLATTKQANISLNYNANDFTLTTTGDGTYYINDPTKLGITINQLITDPSITYKVIFSLDSKSGSNGVLTHNARTISPGIFESVSLGDNLFTYTGKSVGYVNLTVMVQSSNGLEKTAKISLNIQDVNFSFSGGVSSDEVFVKEQGILSFNFSEDDGDSGLDYEMMFSPAVINVDGLKANQWYTIPKNNFSKTFTALNQGTSKVTFTVRNKLTKKAVSFNEDINAYQRPTPTEVGSHLVFTHRGTLESKNNNYEWHINMQITKDPSATIISVKVEFQNGRIFYLNTGGGDTKFLDQDWDEDHRYLFRDMPYVLTITDNKGISSVTYWTYYN